MRKQTDWRTWTCLSKKFKECTRCPTGSNLNRCFFRINRVKLKQVLCFQSVVTRRCTKSTNVNGLDIPEDLVVTLDVLSLHYSEEHWNNPNKFYPERFDIQCMNDLCKWIVVIYSISCLNRHRFSSEHKINKLAYVPFGMGARLCVGIQFALLEIKLTLIKILKSYDILPAFDVKKQLEVSESSIGEVRKFKHGINCIFKQRFVN
jgi:hypothetical protein